MATEIEALQALSTLINSVGLPVTIIVVLFSLYRYERLRVREIQEARILEAEQQNQRRIDDYKGWMQMLASLRNPNQTATNLGGD